MTERRYIESTPQARAKLAAAFLAWLAVTGAYKLWVSPYFAWAASLPTCEALPWVRLELVVGLLACWLTGYIALRQGLSMWKARQTPLPNAWVWSRTRVWTGNYAKLSAIGALAMSALFLLGPVIAFFWHNLYAVLCPAQSCVCG